MNITFDALGTQYQSEVMEIFNHYILTSTAAFPGNSLPEPFFAMLLKKSEGGYPPTPYSATVRLQVSASSVRIIPSQLFPAPLA